MNLPNNATDFIRFMEDIWRMDSWPEANGGIALGQRHGLYNVLHNAVRTARQCGAGRTGGTAHNGERAHVFRFPDETSVIIGYQGNWVALGKRRFSPKKRA